METQTVVLIATAIAALLFWCGLGIAILRVTGLGDTIAMVFNDNRMLLPVFYTAILLWPVLIPAFYLWLYVDAWWHHRKHTRQQEAIAATIEATAASGSDEWSFIGGDYYLVYTRKALHDAMREVLNAKPGDDDARVTKANLPTKIEYPCIATITHSYGSATLQVSTIHISRMRAALGKHP